MPSEGRLRGLGRGLSALLGDEAANGLLSSPPASGAPRTAPIEQLRPGPFQPRRHIPDADLDELARSIAEKGVLQPILVRRRADDPQQYDIIAGERRWRAAQRARLHEVPVVVCQVSDQEALEVALVENLQRRDLTPIEEAEGYRRLLEEHGRTQEDVARCVGKSRSHVANTLRLLSLPDAVRAMLADGRLSAGHARALLATTDPEAAARQVLAHGLNVRQTEALGATSGGNGAAATGAGGPRRSPPKDADTLALERDLAGLLGIPVSIRFRGQGGTLALHYASLDQLDDILRRLRGGAPDSGA